ncbi:hypothetical protein FE257_005929 [Aspergillus nanangensis]|uniref:Polymerase/histidinol phosphatase N-terminal domain-containing protein n=1 Tax=Aspergillus nanangensis TaxID=2582783 RepID=A0AAD4CPV8_ASPNN|nr:hypothetical protein FE257_005929 [Aspergillus nanangensis]
MKIPLFTIGSALLLLPSGTTARNGSMKKTLTGHIDPSEVFSFVYVPFEVELGTTSIYVLQSYSAKNEGNALDLGIFDQRGTETPYGSRGWSGGFRNNFTITPSWATPGYNPGPISPGVWNVVLGPYTSVQEGIDWQLDIEMGFDAIDSYFAPDYATVNLDPLCNGVCTEDGEWLRGDLHLHTVYSDGKYTPDQQIQMALDRNLDFIFFSDHNTDTSNNIMGHYQATLAPDLLIGRAIEVTTRAGHWQAIGLDRGQLIDWRYQDNASFAAAAHEVHRSGGLVSINHPFAACAACNWGFNDWDHNDAIEVWNAEWDSTDQQAVDWWQGLLVSGKRTTAVGGSDAHSPPSLNGQPTTVVRSRGKSQAAIVEGIKAGRTYLVQGPGMDVEFDINVPSLQTTLAIGDKVDGAPASAVAILTATGFSHQKACLLNDKGYFFNTTIKDTNTVHRRIPPNSKFVRVEIRNSTSDGMLALTNPIWLL